MAYYDSGNLDDIEGSRRFDGVRLPDLARHLATANPPAGSRLDDGWPFELLLLFVSFTPTACIDSTSSFESRLHASTTSALAGLFMHPLRISKNDTAKYGKTSFGIEQLSPNEHSSTTCVATVSVLLGFCPVGLISPRAITLLRQFTNVSVACL